MWLFVTIAISPRAALSRGFWPQAGKLGQRRTKLAS
ncbi:hypothetical protein X748_16095 [Mesorhizobium sp. LNJC386A00]|nr:hypothetical protein X748_16095 [Mesorhizobium sp. LNJC386A00]